MTVIFWAAVLLFLNQGAALVKVIVNPEWYHQKRFEAGLSMTFTTVPVISTKIVCLAILGGVVGWAGTHLGYW